LNNLLQKSLPRPHRGQIESRLAVLSFAQPLPFISMPVKSISVLWPSDASWIIERVWNVALNFSIREAQVSHLGARFSIIPLRRKAVRKLLVARSLAGPFSLFRCIRRERASEGALPSLSLSLPASKRIEEWRKNSARAYEFLILIALAYIHAHKTLSRCRKNFIGAWINYSYFISEKCKSERRFALSLSHSVHARGALCLYFCVYYRGVGCRRIHFSFFCIKMKRFARRRTQNYSVCVWERERVVCIRPELRLKNI
jgi:hypothetical protein